MLPNKEQLRWDDRLVQQGKIEVAQLRFRPPEAAERKQSQGKSGGTANSAARRHQPTLSAICKIRGSPSVPVILPKFGFVRPVTGLAEVRSVEQIECFKPVLDNTAFADERQTPSFRQRSVDIREPGSEQDVSSKCAEGVRRGISETGLVEVLRNLLALGTVGIEDGISRRRPGPPAPTRRRPWDCSKRRY